MGRFGILISIPMVRSVDALSTIPLNIAGCGAANPPFVGRFGSPVHPAILRVLPSRMSIYP